MRLAKTCDLATFRCPMSLPEHLEPAVRNPKQLRRTAWILVGLMVVGGWLVLKAYNSYVANRVADDRPAMIHRILPQRSLRVIRQDGEKADLMDLRDKVFAIHVVHLDQLEESRLSLEALKRAAESYVANEDFRIVTLVLNPGPAEKALERLKAAAAEMKVELPQWWVATNDPETLSKFIRKELKPSLPPREVDGRWEFDASIVLVDRNGHLRQGVVPKLDPETGKALPSETIAFDFNQAREWDQEGLSEGIEGSNIEALQRMFNATIDKLLAETHEPGQSAGMSIALVAGGVGLFLAVFAVAIFTFRSRSQRS